MSVIRVAPNITSTRIEESREFYTKLLGFQVAMDMDWIITLVSPSNKTAQISLVHTDESVVEQSQITVSVEVNDVDAIHGKAVTLGHQIVYPLTNETWGVRRFHMKDPNGVLINIMSHNK